MFTYADQVGKKIKEDKIQKNIKKCLPKQTQKNQRRQNIKKYKKNLYLRRSGCQRNQRRQNIKKMLTYANQVGKKTSGA